MADRLIVFVSQNSVLYDKREKNYKDNDFKDNVWRGIANELQYDDVDEVKKLWKNLRDTYVRKKREEGEVKSGQAGSRQKKRWKYMEAMSFLDKSTSFRSSYVKVKSKIKANKDLVMVLNPAFMRYVHDTWLEKKGRYPSTGFMALVLALHICDEVHVFGYGADKDGNWSHYWEKLKDKKLKTGVHPGTHEYGIIQELAEQQKLKFYKGSYVKVKSKIKANKDLVMVLNPAFMRYVHDTWLEKKGRYPSTGFMALVLALHICDEVHVFGYGADKDGNWSHYWEKLKDKKLKTGVHPGTHEYGIIQELAEQQKLKFYKGW